MGVMEDVSMPRKRRIQFEGGLYHVTQRGVARAPIFLDDADRRRFMERLGESTEEDGVRLYLYFLMPNHFHLLIETPRANLSVFMHRLQTAYTLYFNAKHGRTGHLMQGRFHAATVRGDRYLLNLTRYIHLNPVAVGDAFQQPRQLRLRRLREYVWSSYRGYAGLSEPAVFMDERPILAMMRGAGEISRRSEYRRFVEAGLARTDAEWLETYKKSQRGMDAGELRTDMSDSCNNGSGEGSRKNDAALRRMRPRVDAESVLRHVEAEFGVPVAMLRVRTYAGIARSAAVLMLTRHARMSQREAATRLGLGTAVAACLQISRLKHRMARDPALTARIGKLSGAIERST
jgi:REP element-mobilizing transposase RayT